MGATQSADEQKASVLAEENERLKKELTRLKKQIGEDDERRYSSDNFDSGADSGVDSGFDSGADSGKEDNKGPSEEGYVVSDEDNLSVDELISRGLRLQPLFDEKGQCVELVATVVDDIVTGNEQNEEPQKTKKKKKTRKPKKPEAKRTKKRQLKKLKKHRPNKRKTPVITAQLEPDSLMHAVDVEEHEDIVEKARNLKKQVIDIASKYNPSIRLISDPSTIESLLESELNKGEHSAFYLVNLGAVVEKWLQWSKLFPRVEPFYAMKSNPDINIVRTLHFFGNWFRLRFKS